jgi:hypothetical protein
MLVPDTRKCGTCSSSGSGQQRALSRETKGGACCARAVVLGPCRPHASPRLPRHPCGACAEHAALDSRRCGHLRSTCGEVRSPAAWSTPLEPAYQTTPRRSSDDPSRHWVLLLRRLSLRLASDCGFQRAQDLCRVRGLLERAEVSTNRGYLVRWKRVDRGGHAVPELGEDVGPG